MIELDPLYKNVSDTSPPSLSKNMKNERPTIYHLKEENPEIPYI
jgi:heat shock protein HspQ